MHIHIQAMKIIESPLFPSFRGKHNGVCHLIGQTMKPCSIEIYTQVNECQELLQHCVCGTEESQ